MGYSQKAFSGNNWIDGLLWGGWRWDQTVVINFADTAAEYPTAIEGFSTLNPAQREAAYFAFRSIMSFTNLTILEGSGASDINLVNGTKIDTNGDGTPDDSIGTASGRAPSQDHFDSSSAGDIIFNGYANPLAGSFQFASGILHEIGHALGLKHPHQTTAGGPLLDTNVDGLEYTIMSYRDYVGDSTGVMGNTGNSPQSYMMLDIQALQYLYGANYTTNAGATSYIFTPTIESGRGTNFYVDGYEYEANVDLASNIVYRTIWDGGGVDTYDFSRYTTKLTVNLAPGQWTGLGTQLASLVDGKSPPGNIANALLFGGDTRSLIENAVGGSNDDWIRGNQASNFLEGRGGNDTIEGFDGDDVLDQGAGGGGMYGGNGYDTLWAGDGADYLDGGFNSDTVNYSRSNGAIIIDMTIGKVTGGHANNDTFVSIESIIGTNYDDTIAGGDEQNSFQGGGGSDDLYGRGGFDVLQGGNGNDYINGGDVGDQLYGDAGNDTIIGGAGGDYIVGGADFDVASFVNAVSINLQNNSHSGEAQGDSYLSIEQFNLSAGADTFVGYLNTGSRVASGAGVDYLYGGNSGDWFQSGQGADYIDGGSGSDTVSYLDAPGGINADMSFEGDTSLGHTSGKILAGDWGLDTLVSIENVEGSNFDDDFNGDERNNIFWGRGGNDRMEGDFNNTGAPSADTFYGDEGNDTIRVGVGDVAYGGADSDSVSFEGAGAVYINNSTGVFRLNGQYIYLAEFETYYGTALADTVYGGSWGETFSMGAGVDYINGGGGNDFLLLDVNGGDTLDGGTGFDTIVFTVATTASWQTGVLDTWVASSSWLNWEAIQGSSGNDIIRTNSWGYAVTLNGGAGNDILAAGIDGLVGDTLRGEDGDDQLNGGAGADTLVGGDGNDTYYVDNAADWVLEFAGQGYDAVWASVSYTIGAFIEELRSADLNAVLGLTLTGSNYGQYIAGDAGANTIYGNGGLDWLFGGLGSDTLYGGADADRIDGGADADIMSGGAGDDTYVIDSANDKIVEAANMGDDTVESSISYSLAGKYIERLTLTGTANINGTGNSFANTIRGNDGNNILDGGTSADKLYGGLGNDTFIVDNAGDRVFETADEGSDIVKSSVSFSLAGQYVERLILTGSAAIDGTGNSFANTINGNSGNNLIDGGGSADRLYGGLGDDVYVVDNVGDRVFESADEGNDTVRSSVTFSLAGQHIERLTLTGSASVNATGNTLANVIYGNDRNNIIDGGTAADRMYGGLGNDSYVVDNVEDRVYEALGEGTDIVLASVSFNLVGQHADNLTLTGSGATNATGNSLDNVLTGNGANNVLAGGGGSDTANWSAATSALTITLSSSGGGSVTGAGIGTDSYSSIENVIGGSGADTITGNTLNNRIDGGLGADQMYGGAGDDTFIVGQSGDRVYEANNGGNDTVLAAVSFNLAGQYVENLALTGGAAINATGNSLANVITGNGASNILTGGAGTDTFVFNTKLSAASNVDTITDFNAAADTIQLDRAIFTAFAAAGVLAQEQFQDLAVAAADALDRMLYDSGSGDLFYDADGDGAALAIRIANLSNLATISYADFLIA